MSFGYFNNNNKVAVSNGTTVDSSFNRNYPLSTNTTGFKLNGVDICNYITEYALGFQTDNNYGFSVNGININRKFSFNKPVLSIAGGTASTDANYRYYKFTESNSNLTITTPNFQAIKNALNTDPIGIQMLLVGGGGAGAVTSTDYQSQYPGAGGGGAGAFVTIEFDINGSRFNNNTIKISPTIGAGGAGPFAIGYSGAISSVLIEANTAHMVSAGGGEGGYRLAEYDYQVDRLYNFVLSGSSGGATATTLQANFSYQPGFPNTPVGYSISPTSTFLTVNSYQNVGGSAKTTDSVGVSGSHFKSSGGGGGGGAGGPGAAIGAGFFDGGAGGASKEWIDGKYYAGGGGGADNSAQGGLVGVGGKDSGGGTGGTSGGYGSGIPNTGGGGSGGWASTRTTGGSGVCIIAIPIDAYNKYFV
jgi:hypothetical protein